MGISFVYIMFFMLFVISGFQFLQKMTKKEPFGLNGSWHISILRMLLFSFWFSE